MTEPTKSPYRASDEQHSATVQTVANEAPGPSCGHVRDLYPEWPGSVLLICDRRPHRGGKHMQHNPDGKVSVEWWGDPR